MQDLTVIYPPVQKQLPITSEILHFIDCIKTNTNPRPQRREGKQSAGAGPENYGQITRYDIPKTGHLHTPKPFQVCA